MEARALGSQRRVLSREARGSDLSESQVYRKAQLCFSTREALFEQEVPRGGCGVVYQRKGIAGRANSMCKCPGALGCMTWPGNCGTR